MALTRQEIYRRYYERHRDPNAKRGRKIIDLTGHRQGMLTVLRMDESTERGAGLSICWVVRCDCGTERSMRSDIIRGHKQQSCGCLRGSGARFKPKYDIPRSALDRWKNMMRRCYDPTSEKDRRNYMERGIRVCDEWHDPRTFYADMGDPPFNGATLDRRDNNGHYSKENCRWATYSEQNRNRRPFTMGVKH